MKKSTLIYFYLGLIFILCFDIWVEYSVQAEKFFGTWIKPFIDQPKFSIVWTILVIVALIGSFKYILDSKEQEKAGLEETLNSEMRILVMKNKELNNYRLQDNLMYILNKFVHQNSYVNAVQWYDYVENNYQGKTQIKLNFQNGSVAEEVNLNAIHQLYYYCNTAKLRQFRKAKNIYMTGNPYPLVDFIIDIYNSLRKKSERSFNQEDVVLYSLMLLSFEILERDFGISYEDFLGLEAERFRQLFANNRTGIL